MIGTVVGSYRIVAKVAVGGMGTVYRAEHVLIGRPAAVKVLHDEFSGNDEIVSRFLNEAKATTTIKHPGIVEVFDFGHLENGDAFLTMEFLEGMSLARRLQLRGKMTEGEAAMLLRAVCSALGAAHAKNIIHRDLKPDNIFLVTDPESPTGERPKLLDFGIAKATDLGLAGTTRTGAVMGTPTYMSPEQCRGLGEVDTRSDLYSLGCIFYELVTGRPPFLGMGAGELIGAHLLLEVEPPSQHAPGLSAETEALILMLIAKDPAQRPQTTRELAQRLTAIAQHQGWITQTAPAGVTVQNLPRAQTPAAGVPVAGRAPSEPTPTDKPTTLSGAASSIIDVPRRPRRTLAIALSVALAVATGVVVFAMVYSGGGSSPGGADTRPAAAPAPVAAPAPAPVTAPAPAPVAAPAPAPVAAPAPVPVAVPAPVIATPPPKPVAKPSAPAAKPAKLPDKAKQPAKKNNLIETDI